MMIALLAPVAAALALPATPPAAPTGVPARARSNLVSYISDDDYPIEAIQKGDQGTVVFRLSVGADGKVSACEIVSSSGSPILDQTTCRLLQERAQFKPAINARGEAVADSVQARIRWAIPKGSERTKVYYLQGETFVWIINAEGREQACWTELRFESSTRLLLKECGKFAKKPMAEAAEYLGLTGDKAFTLRFDRRRLYDDGMPWPAEDLGNATILSRAEADYQLAPDGTVANCVVYSRTEVISWMTEPCYRKDFTGNIPSDVRRLRFMTQWTASRDVSPTPVRFDTLLDEAMRPKQEGIMRNAAGK